MVYCLNGIEGMNEDKEIGLMSLQDNLIVLHNGERYLIDEYIDKLQEEIKELEFIVGLRQKRSLIRKFDEEYDEEDKKKNPNREYAGVSPDAEVVYQRYYKQKEVIDGARDYLEYYLIDNMKYKDSQKEFKKLLQMLDKVKDVK